LPPYIKTFTHSDSAAWNTTQFLGRPEPLYTYSNGKREGSIEFFILTDFAQSVDIGEIDDTTNNPALYLFDNDKHFTNQKVSKGQQDNIQASIESNKKKLQELTAKKNMLISGDTQYAEISADIAQVQEKINKLEDVHAKNSTKTSKEIEM
jgi:hypothetical protein